MDTNRILYPVTVPSNRRMCTNIEPPDHGRSIYTFSLSVNPQTDEVIWQMDSPFHIRSIGFSEYEKAKIEEMCLFTWQSKDCNFLQVYEHNIIVWIVWYCEYHTIDCTWSFISNWDSIWDHPVVLDQLTVCVKIMRNLITKIIIFFTRKYTLYVQYASSKHSGFQEDVTSWVTVYFSFSYFFLHLHLESGI